MNIRTAGTTLPPFWAIHGDAPANTGVFMSWLLLFLAGLLETVWATGLKYSEGFTRLWPSIGTFTAMAVSFWLLATAMKSLPMGTAYSVWTGIGAVGAVILGIVLFNEPVTLARIGCVSLIILGIVGLRLTT